MSGRVIAGPAQENNLTEWEAWAAGDAYFYTVEKAVTWTTDDGHVDEEMTTCEVDAGTATRATSTPRRPRWSTGTTTQTESKEA